MIDSNHRTNFVSNMRKFATQNDDRIRVESGRNCNLNYYTNSVDNIEKLIQYVERIKAKEPDITNHSVDLNNLLWFPGDVHERNIRYRKKRLPYGKYEFQVLSDRMNKEDWLSWRVWAEQYPDKIRLEPSTFTRHFGTWSGEPLAYVLDEKMLQLIQFKLGSNIQKIIHYKIRETE
jgi:predicted metalloendopeptidase